MRDQSPPACGVSTLITSAPCCASIIAQDGPATPPVRSMTFTPANALSQSMLTVRFHPVRVVLAARVADLGRGDKSCGDVPLNCWRTHGNNADSHQAGSLPPLRRSLDPA